MEASTLVVGLNVSEKRNEPGELPNLTQAVKRNHRDSAIAFKAVGNGTVMVYNLKSKTEPRWTHIGIVAQDFCLIAGGLERERKYAIRMHSRLQ